MSRFSCPNCGKSYKWNSQLVGRQAKCSGCQERITVPEVGLDDSEELDLFKMTSAPKPKKRPLPSSSESPFDHLSSENTRIHKEEAQPKRWLQIGLSAAGVLLLLAIRIVPGELRRMAREAKEEQVVSALEDDEDASEAVPPMAESPEQRGDITGPAIVGDPEVPRNSPRQTLKLPGNRNQTVDVNMSASPTPQGDIASEVADELADRAPGKEEPLKQTDSVAKTATPEVVAAPSTPAKPVTRFPTGDPSKIRFELFNANVIEKTPPAPPPTPQGPFATAPFPRPHMPGPGPDFGISLNYRIKPTDEVINVHIYQLKLRVHQSEEAIPIINLQAEGQVQAAFKLFGGDHQVHGVVTAWVEQVDPNNPGTISRVSEVVTLGRTTVVPPPVPPPLATANTTNFKFDRTLPPAMKAARDKFQKEMAEKKRPAREEDFDQLIADLEGSDDFRMREALNKLQRTPSKPKYADRVSKALETIFETHDGFVKSEVFKTLKVWPSDVSYKLIALGLQDESFVVHGEALRAITKPEKIPNLDQLLVDLSLQHGKEHEVEPILVKLGPSAEKETIRLLESRDDGRVKLGLRVLGRIGGKASIAPVQHAWEDGNVFVKREAEMSLKQIKRRIKG